MNDTQQITPQKKKHRVFMWFFIIVQVIFLIWIIAGAASKGSSCNGLSASDCANASDVGHSIAVGIQLVLWAVVDIILGAIRFVVLTARKRG